MQNAIALTRSYNLLGYSDHQREKKLTSTEFFRCTTLLQVSIRFHVIGLNLRIQTDCSMCSRGMLSRYYRKLPTFCMGIALWYAPCSAVYRSISTYTSWSTTSSIATRIAYTTSEILWGEYGSVSQANSKAACIFDSVNCSWFDMAVSKADVGSIWPVLVNKKDGWKDQKYPKRTDYLLKRHSSRTRQSYTCQLKSQVGRLYISTRK